MTQAPQTYNTTVFIAEIFLANLAPQCVCLVDESGNRTMRPCLSNAVKVQVNVSFPVSKYCRVYVFALDISAEETFILFRSFLYLQADELTREDLNGSKVRYP